MSAFGRCHPPAPGRTQAGRNAGAIAGGAVPVAGPLPLAPHPAHRHAPAPAGHAKSTARRQGLSKTDRRKNQNLSRCRPVKYVVEPVSLLMKTVFIRNQ